jgi:VanZ family protein
MPTVPQIRAAVWLLAMAVWTVLLLTPDPAKSVTDSLSEDESFTLAKMLHVTAYACLTVSGVWAFRPHRALHYVAWGLVLHGAVTEFLQTFVPTRSGTVRDVILDSIGVVIGVLVVRRWFPRWVEGEVSPPAQTPP